MTVSEGLLLALTYTLIEIADPAGTAAYLADSSHPVWQRTALRVLDQMKQPGLTPSMVMPLLASDDLAVRNEARRIIAGRADWKPESYAITMSDGGFHSGLINRENRDAIDLRNADQRETRIRRDQIREIRLSPLSAMPEALAESLDQRELADLVAFLAQCQ